MVNDQWSPADGKLTIALVPASGEPIELASAPFALAPLGQQTFNFEVTVPANKGKFVLEAIAAPTGGAPKTISRRKVEIVGKSH
jgi:hypothetical protein